MLGHFIIRALGGFVLIGVVAGCATQSRPGALASSFARTRSYQVSPKYNGSRVAAYVTNRPTKPYIEVGVISIRAVSYPRVLWYARHRAAKEGCDAIFQLSTNRVMANVDGFVIGGVVSAEASYHTVGRFSCLIWRSSAELR